VPAIAPEHTANRHISVTDRLELLQSVTGDDAVERREILIEETDERCWLGSFGQQREALEIGEQNGRRARIFRLHLAVFPEFVGDCCRQNGVKEFFGACFLGSRFDPRLVQVLDCLIMLDQSAAQFQLCQNLA
jgi:hypothetical protein